MAAVAAAVHARCLSFGFVGLDDRDLIVADQAFLTRPSSLWRAFGRSYLGVVDAGHAYYRPLVTASLALNARWSGAGALGYHATNVALHASTCALVLLLLRRIGLGRAASLGAALLFALHPVLTPAVAWIPGRNDTLLALFGVAAWLSYLRGARLLHVLLFAMSLLTKETAVALPLVWAAHALLLEPELRAPRSLGLHAAAWGALVAARMSLHPTTVTAGAAAPLAVLAGLFAGLGKLVLYVRPTVLAVAQDTPVWPGVASALALAAATAYVPGVRPRVMALGAAVFALLLLPPLLLTGLLALDQRLYLPAVGAVLMLAEIVRALAPGRGEALAYGGAALAVLAALTVGFQGVYRDERSFAREAVSGSPHCALAHLCLGQSDQRGGDDDGALAEYRAALALGPAEVAHNNIAVIEMKRGLWATAERELRDEIAQSPRYGKAQYNLAIVLRREGRPTESCAAATAAAALSPDDDGARAERARDCP